MTLTARVVRIESAASWPDGMTRVVLRVAEADGALMSEIRVPNTGAWRLDDDIVIDARRVTEADRPAQEIRASRKAGV